MKHRNTVLMRVASVALPLAGLLLSNGVAAHLCLIDGVPGKNVAEVAFQGETYEPGTLCLIIPDSDDGTTDVYVQAVTVGEPCSREHRYYDHQIASGSHEWAELLSASLCPPFMPQ